MYTHPRVNHYLQTRITPNGHMLHLSQIAPSISMFIASTMPIMQFRGRTLYMQKTTEKECRRAYANATQCWFLLHSHTNTSTTFMLHTECGFKRTRHAIVAWHFPIEHLQFRVRRFLTRRRKERRLALTMALHPRLGADSAVHKWLNEDTLCRICASI